MVQIILIFFTGLALGFLCRKFSFLSKTEKTISLTVFVMLFVLGVSIGSNRQIIESFWSFGWQAAILAGAASIGSMLAAWLVFTFFFKKGGRHEK